MSMLQGDAGHTAARGVSYMANNKHHVVGGANLSDEERAQIEKLLSCLEDMRQQRSSMTVSQAIALLYAALNEGMSVGDLADKVGLAQSVMSRHLLDLGEYTRSREPGAGLVQRRMGARNLRIHEVVVTSKGAVLLRRIARLLGR